VFGRAQPAADEVQAVRGPRLSLKPSSAATSSVTSAGFRHRARVRCGWNRRRLSGGGAPARLAPAATDSASRPSALRSPARPLHSTFARAAAGKAPAPANASRTWWWRRAARSSRGMSRATAASSTWPRKASVTCHASRLVQRRSRRLARHGSTRSSSSSSTAGGGAMATNSRMRSPGAAVDPGGRSIPSGPVPGRVRRAGGSKPVRGGYAGSLSTSAR
jgi:hypothetical protein